MVPKKENGGSKKTPSPCKASQTANSTVSHARTHPPTFPKPCKFTSSAYFPPTLSNSRCVPLSTILPWSNTYIISAFWIVLRRCATAMVVRPRAAASKAACTTFSDSESRAEVASSSRRTFGSRRRARAIAMRCF